MFFIIRSALAFFFGKVLQAAVIKFFIFGIIALIATELLPLIVTALLPSTSNLDSSIAGLDNTFFFYADVFMVFQGLSICLSALATRFIIRRIPFFG